MHEDFIRYVIGEAIELEVFASSGSHVPHGKNPRCRVDEVRPMLFLVDQTS